MLGKPIGSKFAFENRRCTWFSTGIVAGRHVPRWCLIVQQFSAVRQFPWEGLRGRTVGLPNDSPPLVQRIVRLDAPDLALLVLDAEVCQLFHVILLADFERDLHVVGRRLVLHLPEEVFRRPVARQALRPRLRCVAAQFVGVRDAAGGFALVFAPSRLFRNSSKQRSKNVFAAALLRKWSIYWKKNTRTKLHITQNKQDCLSQQHGLNVLLQRWWLGQLRKCYRDSATHAHTQTKSNAMTIKNYA